MRALAWGGMLTVLGGLALQAADQTESASDAVQVVGASIQTRERLQELENRLRTQPDTDAVDELVRCVDENGDVLVAVDGRRYVSARYWIHVLLSRLPPQLLEPWRLRIDPAAAQLLADWQQRGDATALREIIVRYPLSRPARTALLVYGDLLWQRGEAAAAWATWEHLLPDGAVEWTHPDVRDKQHAELVAKVLARRVLVRIVEGDLDQAWRDWERLSREFPHSRGRLAGREGLYHELLAPLLRQPPRYPRPTANGRFWSTFGAQPSRNPVLPRLPALGGERPTWQVELTQWRRREADPDPLSDRQLGPFPVANAEAIFLTDGLRLFAYDICSGKPLFTHDLLTAPQEAVVASDYSTLTIDEQAIYLRHSSPRLRTGPQPKSNPASPGELICLRLHRGVNGQWTVAKAWQLPPPGDDAFWHGAPLVVDRRLWVAYGRLEGSRLHHGVACYEPADAQDVPRLRWRSEVCSSPWLPHPRGLLRLELLTWADGRIVFNTNSGVIVALDAHTGHRLWAFRYPRSLRNTVEIAQHPAPAIYDDGRIFVAPVDASAVYALEASEGRLLWQWPNLEGAVLHAATPQHLLVSIRRPQSGLAAINVRTGSARRSEGGWFIPLRETAHAGAALLTSQAFLYPLRTGCVLLRADDGAPCVGPTLARLRAGAYLLLDDILIGATPHHLFGYLSERLRFSPIDTPEGVRPQP